MKYNKNLRNCYIVVTKLNVEKVLPIAKLFPKDHLGFGTLSQTLENWIYHFNSRNSSIAYYIINSKGELSYTLNSINNYKSQLEGKKELTDYKQLQETLQERIKNFKI